MLCDCRKTVLCAALALGLAAAPSALRADEEPRAMSAVDLLSLETVSRPLISDDGGRIVFARSSADWKKDRRATHLWRIAADGGAAVQMTNGARGEGGAAISPDGRTLAFVARRGDDKSNQIYLIKMDGGEAVRLGRHATRVRNLQWARDGGGLYFVADDDRSALRKKRRKVKDDMIRYDAERPHRHIWFVDMDGAARQITDGGFYVINYSLSLDGDRIVYNRAPTSLLDDRWDGEIWVADADGGNALRLTDNDHPEGRALMSPDNRLVLFQASVNATGDPYYQSNLFVVPASGGPVRLLAEDMPHAVVSARWGRDARTIYFVANMGVHTQLFRMRLRDERLTQLTEGEHSINGWDYARGANTHALLIARPDSPGEIHTLKDGGSPRQVTRAHADLGERFRLPRVELVQWRADDGVAVEGLLYYPLDYERGRRYPLAVQTHGGPLASDRYGSFSTGRYAQVLAARGWAVLQVNYRGSIGYGDAFARDMVGGYFTNAHLDVMDGVDELVRRGIADGERLVKMGWSAGGHLTNKIITHTDRFSAASSGAGAVNWVSMYGQTDIRKNRSVWFGGPPWGRDAPIDTYWKHSPLSEIWKARTPTLVLVGEHDRRVPAAQSVELHRALRFNGVPTRLYMAPRAGHGWSRLFAPPVQDKCGAGLV